VSVRVSIVIPVHNQASRLRLTLLALSQQTGVDLRSCELVVVDDASSDEPDRCLSDEAVHSFGAVALVRCSSGGRRGLPRNLGVQIARGELIIFLDADACPGSRLVSLHVEQHRRHRCIALGDCFVVEGTESLSDPCAETTFPQWRSQASASPGIEPLCINEAKFRRGSEAYLRPHAVKGIYPGQVRWHEQLEDLLVASSFLNWVGVIPHNLSVRREDFVRLGGFDIFLKHHEGWDIGLRSRKAGLMTRFAAGAATFHLFHWRAPAGSGSEAHEAARLLCERHGGDMPEAAFVWFAAAARDSVIPDALNLNNWRAVEGYMSNSKGRAILATVYRAMRDRTEGVGLTEYCGGVALNAPLPILHPQESSRV
jgi:GT2 family glycosyltransferase